MATPTKTKKLRGTFRDDRDGAKMDVVPIAINAIQKLEPPKNFDAPQKKLWKEIIQMLGQVGLLQIIGLHTINMYCEQFKFYSRAAKQIDELGPTVVTDTKYGPVIKKNPAYEALMNSYTILADISKQFGFSPLSQSRIKNIGLNAEDPKEDKFGL